MHSTRVRRVLGRKHQVQRRTHCYETTLDSTSVTLSSSSRTSVTLGMGSRLESTSTASASTFRVGRVSSQRRHNPAVACHLFPGRTSDRYSDQVCSLMSMQNASTFAVGCRTNQDEDAWASPLPLPPVVQRINMPGSPFSPYAPYDYSYETMDFDDQRRCLRAGNMYGGARTHSNGGSGSGSGGGSDGPDATAPASGGDGEAGEGETPSEYTFRRRNAIVEGSEEAPRADDFTGGSD